MNYKFPADAGFACRTPSKAGAMIKDMFKNPCDAPKCI
jgi:hypothetical protein